MQAKLQNEQEKLRLDVEYAIEKMKQQTEQAKLQVEQNRLDLMRDGKISVAAQVSSGPAEQSAGGFDIKGNLRLVPKFSERDPEAFFAMFERVADVLKWPDSARALMLQCVLTGRAQEVLSAMNAADSQKYAHVKVAVLKSYELVPEAYRQRFRFWKKHDKQCHLEFARDLTMNFNRWCSASEVEDFEGLQDLMILEQFKNSVPARVATYISEQKARNAADAAALADDFVLTHRGDFKAGGGNYVAASESHGRCNKPLPVDSRTNTNSSRDDPEKVCNYCHKPGHWKKDCFMLNSPGAKNFNAGHWQPEGVATAAPVRPVSNCVTPTFGPNKDTSVVALNSYRPFIMQGSVSLVQGGEEVPVTTLRELAALIQEFPGLFGDTPSCTHLIEHDIDIGDAKPIKQRFYRVNADKRNYLEAEVDYMLTNDIAEPCTSSWASPCILVPKPDGTFRFCSDFRKVNNVTKPDSFPLPRMEDCIDQVGSAKFVSKFDLLKGYWQVPLSARAREIAAFITPNGLYSYKVMPFGLRNAPATFQRLMNQVIWYMPGCAVYLDDVVVYSDNWEIHLDRIRELFNRLREARLTVNLAKCEFARATVTYLGRVVGQGQVCPVGAKGSSAISSSNNKERTHALPWSD